MIEFKRRNPATVANAEPGGDVLFLDSDGVFKTKDALGNMTVLGNGIEGITKVGASGLVDTYEIAFTSGHTFQYTVTNAKSIVELVKLGTSVLDSTYRITFNDGPAFEYVVKDGRGIANIEAPANAGQPNTTDTYTVRYNDGTTSTFIVRNGRDGLDGLVLSVNGKSEPNIVLNAADVGALAAAEKGAPNGVATLGADSKIPAAQLPAYVDDVLEFANLAAFPATGETGKIYVAIDTGFTYRWSGSQYIEISAAPVTQVNGKVGNVTLTTSDIAEGTNLYFTAARVRDTILTGLSLATNAAITASDSVLSAFGKLQKQLTDHFAAVDPHPQYTTDAEATTIAQGRVTAHEALPDPHPQYTTTTEAAAAAPVQSVNGQTGNVTINVPLPLNANRVGLFASTANSTAVQPFLTLTIPANRIVAGATYSFLAVGTQSQSAAATNVVFTVQVNGVTVATASVAGGTAAQTNRGLNVEGMLQFTVAGASGQVIGGIEQTVSGIAANSQVNVAGVAVNTTANVTITLTAQTSTANAANIIRVAAASISERA